MTEVARFLWWMAAAALVLPFIDIVQRTFGGRIWLQRATRPRIVLAALELSTVGAWLAVRGRWRFLPEQDATVAIAGSVLALTGALFAAWSKAALGRHFSPQLGVQAGHRLITTGPYAVVRHPMYLGIIDFIIGTALYLNDVALFGAGLLFIVYFSAQSRVEERLFADHFGAEWRAYSERTPRLFPWSFRQRPR